MNAFVEHHRESIRFQYSCFDRILFNAIIQPLQRPPVIVGFLDQYRHVPSLTRQYFRQVSENYHRWAEKLAAAARTRIVEPPKGVDRPRRARDSRENLAWMLPLDCIARRARGRPPAPNPPHESQLDP
jgi:hypothetical protein